MGPAPRRRYGRGMLTVLARIAVLSFASAGHAADVYRCVSGDGVEYRDQPCAEHARATLVAAAPAGAHLVFVQGQPLGNVAPAADGPVTAGMAPRAVYQALGRPTEMNVRIEGILPIERWWYRTPEGTLTVTFRHGRVVSAVTR